MLILLSWLSLSKLTQILFLKIQFQQYIIFIGYNSYIDPLDYTTFLVLLLY
jgi:hypothetical protein